MATLELIQLSYYSITDASYREDLDWLFSILVEGLKDKNAEALVRSFAINPRKILGLEDYTLTENATANLTLFTTEGETLITERANNSRSKNSPFFNQTMQGRVVGIINGSRSYFN